MDDAPRPPAPTGRDPLVMALLVCGFVLTSVTYGRHQASPDLLATWMAADAFARGAWDAIYAGSDGLFTMRPPEAWVAPLRAAGHDAAIYPYVYPPLWAWLVSGLTHVTDYAAFRTVASVVNPLLLAGTVWLAARAAGDGVRRLTFVLTGLVLMAVSLAGVVAIEQNQPAILVGFLLVLAVERDRAGHPVAAGAALAVAAALKLYPAVFVLIWLARGRWRAAAAFAGVGGTLGLVSLAVGGWDLHMAFLAEVRAISSTVLTTYFTWNLDSTVWTLLRPEGSQFVPDISTTAEGAGWTVLTKPPLWALFDKAALAGFAVALWAAARRTDDAILWPLAFAGLALISPLTWGYHYLPALAFLPALALCHGRAGAWITLVAVAPVSVAAISLPSWALWAQPGGTLAMAVMTAGFGVAAFGAPVGDRATLRRVSQPL